MSQVSIPRNPLPNNSDSRLNSGSIPTQRHPASAPKSWQDLELGQSSPRNGEHRQVESSSARRNSLGGRKLSFFSRRKKQVDGVSSYLHKHYNGGMGVHFFPLFRYRRPTLAEHHHKKGDASQDDAEREFEYLNVYGIETRKRHDVAVYLSKTHYEPRRLLVQCTKEVWAQAPHTGDWRRVRIKGSVPTVVRMAEWALRPADPKPSRKDPHGRKHRNPLGILVAVGRTILVGPFLQMLLALPGMQAPWEDNTDIDDKYEDYPGYHWEWPVFAVNKLDMTPSQDLYEITSNKRQFSAKKREQRPQRLVVYDTQKDEWRLEEKPSAFIPYVLASFTRAHFNVDGNVPGQTHGHQARAKQEVEKLARYATRQHFQGHGSRYPHPKKFGYWLDFQCGPEQNMDDPDKDYKMDHDVNTICDIVRSASQVIIVLPQDPEVESEKLSAWGRSLWTMTEAMLAHGDIKFCWPTEPIDLSKELELSEIEAEYGAARRADFDGMDKASQRQVLRAYQLQKQTECNTTCWSKLEMSDKFWEKSKNADASEEEDAQPARILAEHYSGTLTLSRIELFTTALAALEDRMPDDADRAKELTPALMALLHYRIDLTKADTLFSSLCRLNMANDNDDMIERMICWAPTVELTDLPSNKQDVFNKYRLTYPDLFGSRLWDLKPTCRLVGLGREENTIMVDGCRAMSIRWKNFPRMKYKRHSGFKKLIAETLVRSGCAWVAGGFYIVYYYFPFLLTGATPSTDGTSDTNNASLRQFLIILFMGFTFAVGFILSLFGPSCVRRLYGGSVLESTSRLIGFEGTMKIENIEAMIFGNHRDRLSYEPSASLLAGRNARLREGKEPGWMARPDLYPRPTLPKTHRLFTLVDTGRLTVTIFTAEKPPTVALLCGRDGGMLRAVLCSWDFRTDCLYKEAVIRMPSDVWEGATGKSWLKLCLLGRPSFAEL